MAKTPILLFTSATCSCILHVLFEALPATSFVEFNFNASPKQHRDGEGETLIARLR